MNAELRETWASRCLRGGLVLFGLLLSGWAHAAEPDVAASTLGQIMGLVFVVMAFGAIGGFVDGLTSDVVFKLSFGTWSMDIGSAGDALAGATASIAIFTVGTALFPDMDLRAFGSDLAMSMRVIAISVLSGYAGVRLLNPMTRKLVEKISADSAVAAAKANRSRSDDASISIKDGDKLVNRYDLEKSQLDEPGQFSAAIGILDEAQNAFESALQIDPLDAEALLGMARVMRRRAERLELNNQPAGPQWQKALDLLTRLISNSPDSARAYYNRACYQALQLKQGDPEEQVISDLSKSVGLLPGLKSRAVKDRDFKKLADSQAFKTLVGS